MKISNGTRSCLRRCLRTPDEGECGSWSVLLDGKLVCACLVLAASAAVVLLSFPYLEDRSEHKEEFYILLLLATVGSMVLAASSHMVSFFLGLELLSISLYALIAYPRIEALPLEAGIKYLVLAASSSAFADSLPACSSRRLSWASIWSAVPGSSLTVMA